MWLILKPIVSVLRAIPWWAYAIAICLAWGAWQRHRANATAAEYQHAQAEAAQQREAALAASIAETARRLAAQQEATRNADAQTLKARGNAAAAGAAADRLRAKLAAVNADAGASHSTAASASATGRLADILATCADRYRDVAASADRAVIAGSACVASYEALTH
jgi:hypothetical protein